VATAPQLTGVEQHAVLKEALVAAQAITDKEDRGSALAQVVLQLGEYPDLLREMLAMAQPFWDGRERDSIARESLSLLALIAPHLGAYPNLLREAVSIIKKDRWYLNQALVWMAPHLGAYPELLQDALTIARAISDDEERSKTLVELAPQLPKEEQRPVLQEALAASNAGVRFGNQDWLRRYTLEELVPQLRAYPDLLWDALEVVQSIAEEGERGSALATVASQLATYPGLLREALATLQMIAEDQWRYYALAHLAPQLRDYPDLLREALEDARGFADEMYRSKALVAVAQQLPDLEQQRVLQEALTVVRTIAEDGEDEDRNGNWQRADPLVAVADQLSNYPELVQDALAIARTVTTLEQSRIEALAAIAVHLPMAKQQTVLREALMAAQCISGEDGSTRKEVLEKLAPLLAAYPDLLREALAIAQTITDDEWRSRTLAMIVPQLGNHPELLPEALTAAHAIVAEEDLSEALAALVPQLSTTYQADMRRRVRTDLLTQLDKRASKGRSDVLALCTDKKLFAPPFIATTTLSMTAQSIVEVCQEWLWL
jgi:hypothetical protein